MPERGFSGLSLRSAPVPSEKYRDDWPEHGKCCTSVVRRDDFAPGRLVSFLLIVIHDVGES